MRPIEKKIENAMVVGAFQGGTPREAYFVKCDQEVNPAEDMARNVNNLLVGFAATRPAEFLILRLSFGQGL